MSNADVCPFCKTPILNWAAAVCPECFGGDGGIGVPNQRELRTEEEQQALEARYQQAKQNNESLQIAELETAIEKDSSAVINIDDEDLALFLKNAKKLYTNYQHQIDAGIRLPAEMKNDRERSGTDGDLFGGECAKNIHYAALSLTDKGLDSYGDCTVILKDASMKWRASVLEENSFDFRKKHAQQIVVENGIPKGYRAVWAERHLLAVAKLAAKLNGVVVNLSELLLNTQGNRHTDDFMEVHIYGGVSHQTIAKVVAPENSPYFARIFERATLLGIECLAA